MAAPPAGSPAAHRLPAFDEYFIAYRDRRAVLDPAHAKRLNAGGGRLRPCVVVNGRAAGTWPRVLGRSTVKVELELFEAPALAARAMIVEAARRYRTFLGLKGEIVTR